MLVSIMQQTRNKNLLQNYPIYTIDPYTQFKENMKKNYEKELYYKKYIKYEKKEFNARNKKEKNMIKYNAKKHKEKYYEKYIKYEKKELKAKNKKNKYSKKIEYIDKNYALN